MQQPTLLTLPPTLLFSKHSTELVELYIFAAPVLGRASTKKQLAVLFGKPSNPKNGELLKVPWFIQYATSSGTMKKIKNISLSHPNLKMFS